MIGSSTVDADRTVPVVDSTIVASSADDTSHPTKSLNSPRAEKGAGGLYSSIADRFAKAAYQN